MSGGASAPASKWSWNPDSTSVSAYRADINLQRLHPDGYPELKGWVRPLVKGGWTGVVVTEESAYLRAEFPTKQEAMAYVETVCRLEAA